MCIGHSKTPSRIVLTATLATEPMGMTIDMIDLARGGDTSTSSRFIPAGAGDTHSRMLAWHEYLNCGIYDVLKALFMVV